MRIANLAGRAVLVHDGLATDIASASDGRFGPAPIDVLRDWAEFVRWGAEAPVGGEPFDEGDLLAPIPDPGQVFAIGLNYRDHADEAHLAHPEDLVVFTKFQSSLAGPRATVRLPSDRVDWETELVLVIGTEIHDIDPEQAWDAVAGLAIGQDLSERAVQQRGPVPQFSLGKSFPGFAPYGPAIVTLDEVADRDALGIRAEITGPTAAAQAEADPSDGAWVVQDGNTRELIFSVPRIVADLSRVVTLRPGDLIFTGTPAGVGMGRGVYLAPGDVLTSTIEGLGELRNEFVG